jgi:hypothetical protein
VLGIRLETRSLDLTNLLDLPAGFSPTPSACNTTSLGEQLQAGTTAKVEARDTVAASIMMDPASVANGDHDLFLCGDDEDAKRTVRALLEDRFGWKRLIDLGDTSMARDTEMYVAL